MDTIDEIRDNAKRDRMSAPTIRWDCGHPGCEFSAEGEPEEEERCDGCERGFCRAHLVSREQESFSGKLLVYRWCFRCAEGLDVETEWDRARHEAFVAGYLAGHHDVGRARLLLRQIITDLPVNRDWLDPAIETEARTLLAMPAQRRPE